MRNDLQHRKSVFEGFLVPCTLSQKSLFQKSAKHKSHDVRVSDEGDNDEDEDDDDDDTEDVGDANDTSSSDSESKLTKRTQKAHDSSGDSDSDEHTQAASRKRAKKPLASKQKVDMRLKHVLLSIYVRDRFTTLGPLVQWPVQL